MPKLNENYQNVKDSYLFAEIARRVKVYEETHPEKAADIIRLGIGDVTLPLTKSVIEALHEAVDSQAVSETFKGYGPEQGYAFAQEAIADYYARNGVEVKVSDIFISDGAKSDTGNITELFAKDNVVLVPDPVYPVYVDTNTMDGKNIIYMNGTKENDFLPMPDENVKADIIYLCSPNNPTGACYNKEQLEAWVAYALKNDAVILYDSAYEAFITDPTLPRSIYAIEGAKKCAIEFCSLSKTAGFTGTRFSYTVVPEELVFETSNGETLSLHNMWNRRQCTKFNGTPYIIQYAGAKVFTEEGMKECQENIGYYRENAHMIAETLEKKGISFTGGVNSPYIWFECPKGMESWEFFDYLLENAQIVGTPGAGFGENGKNYFRLTSFGKHEKTKEAMERFNALF
ncbi:LL-diaminopimelate aminotransferase [Ruminococcus sp. AF25-13]|jgi:LL-diaminopimelate aminotransferase|nr:LL-diaminopimelate aminotransferase [Mediterraneibacter faecis]RGD84938.1 LL-diaminopimelate aminotransferase [Ruminococcus sp. TF10-6]RGF29467.1 LL-diaminopimelate aminotransferase [Ruminococcus sp. AM09-18-1]RGF68049.1 LL-diaminopimelate aminotransferase [Ruminococcus sp. AF32-2AC]RGF75942.1 LL-diaminopimelate aminotransferase [Ruminococcus sp. AF31-14BH]RGG04619.1 LL-diaminopimelate aminotransferase [Ruminococcus sp. AF27-3]RGG11816.1 LL-diaminopimelate aminotransferase [Ruminococcus sp